MEEADYKELLKVTEDRMKKTVEATRHDMATVRTGRASAVLLDRISVDYYGTVTPLNQIASISVPEPRMLTVQPWDKSAMSSIEKAIMKSDLGLTPSNDGNVIRLPIPQLTEERRKDLIKVVRGVAEVGRVSIRNIRRDSNEKMKDWEKNHEISKDDVQHGQVEVQKLTDKYIKDVDTALLGKENEILEV